MIGKGRVLLKKILDKYWLMVDAPHSVTIHWKREKPFEHCEQRFNDERINKSFEYDSQQWFHTEYVTRIKTNVVIEPQYGACIWGGRYIIPSSLFFSNLKPSVPRFLLRRHGSTPIEKLILFDGKIGGNYFHFFSDVFHKIWLLDKIPNVSDYTIIISKKTFETLYFQYFHQSTFVGKLQWYVQGTSEYIKTRDLVLLHPMPYEPLYFSKTRALLSLPNTIPFRKLFLTRSVKSGRFISNFAEIDPILKQFDFEIMDTNGRTLEEQAVLFNSVSHLVSIHGAGNTNIIFSQKSLRFLELCPSNRTACHYYWLATSLGIDYYDCFLGSELPHVGTYPEGGFEIDPGELSKAIERLLNL